MIIVFYKLQIIPNNSDIRITRIVNGAKIVLFYSIYVGDIKWETKCYRIIARILLNTVPSRILCCTSLFKSIDILLWIMCINVGATTI